MAARFTKDFDRLLASEYASGKTAIEVAKKYNINKTSVLNAIRRTGEKVRPSPTLPKFNDAKQKEIAFKYKNGMSSKYLAKKYNITGETILSYVRHQGIEIRTPGGTLTPTQIKVIAEAYEKEGSSTPIAKQFGVTPTTVIRSAKKHDKKIICDTGRSRKLHYNQHFFASWSPDMAYYLGFFFADGSLDEYTVRFHQKEPSILYKLAEIVNYTGTLYMCGTHRNMHTLIFSSKTMVDSLKQYGLTPGSKSLTMTVPYKIKYPIDFVRGYFDGDGHGGWYKKRKGHTFRIGFTSGSRDFLVRISKLLPIKIGGPYQGKGNSSSLQTTSIKTTIILRDWLYSGESDIFIKRKRDSLYQY